MSVAWLRASLALWTRRLAFRRRRHAHWHRRHDRRLAAKWHHLVEQAEAMVERRRRQLAEHERARPAIVTSRQLGLTFQDVFGAKGRPYRRTGHYSAGPRARTRRDLIARMREFHAQHKAQRWGGGSYDAVIADDGTLGLLNPIGRKGAHVAGHNSGNVGINCPGKPGDRPTKAQEATLRWYLANAHTRRVPAAYRSPVDLRRVRGYVHSDLNATQCPGDFKPMFRRVR